MVAGREATGVLAHASSHPDAQESTIYVIGREGRGLRRVTRGAFARWSPDGRRFVVTAPTRQSAGNLFVVKADGSGRRRLTRTPWTDFAAGWSRDGRKILFTRFVARSSGDVMVVDVGSGRARKLADGFAGSWSPDGTRILYTWSHELYVMNADGSQQRRFAPLRANDPDWR